MVEQAILKLSWLGEGAILCDTDRLALDLTLQERFWALGAALSKEDFVREVVPGMNNLLVMLQPSRIAGASAMKRIRAHWAALDGQRIVGREIEIPVHYGGARGPDLSFVAAAVGVEADQYARRHSEGRYTVFNLGSQPGFGYLAGLDPVLAVSRRDVPRMRVEAGSVCIGGAQTGVISKTSPSGWHVIGWTETTFFDATQTQPALLAPGDTIRFRMESLSL
jgi:5-oxoprolinase (ATP-hydrolysing) subunit B